MNEGVVPGSVSGMDDHAGSLVQDDQIVILEENRQRDGQENEFSFGRGPSPLSKTTRRVCFSDQRTSVFQSDFPFIDCFFDPRPRFGKATAKILSALSTGPSGQTKRSSLIGRTGFVDQFFNLFLKGIDPVGL